MKAPAVMPDGDAKRVRRNQMVLFSVMAAAALMLIAAWFLASGGKAPSPAARIDAELAGPGTAEESWTRRSETRLGLIEGQLREMEAESRTLARENQSLRDRLQKNADDARLTIDRQAVVIDELRRGGANAEIRTPGQDGDMFRSGNTAQQTAGSRDASTRTQPQAMPPLIETFQLEETGEDAEAPAGKDLGAWLPAGSHAEAVVLAGVDASAGIASQGDPRPVLLRIVGPAWTASEEGTALAVDIDGCTVTGAAHGDLSSEKVYARLRTLTCAGDESGTVIETEVAGFVAGAGKTGVRGPVVSREGALVEKAFLAGLVSGVGQGVAGAFAPQAVATGGGAAVANTGLADIGRAGLGAGASSAGQKVADYLIRRAEQYQPVIQLQAGTPVTVVFIEGARLDGLPGSQSAGRNR